MVVLLEKILNQFLFNMPTQVNVIFYSTPLTEKLEDMKAALLDDPILHEAIKWYSNELKKEDIETFMIDKNMIVTESGYKFALREETVKELEK